MTDEGRTGVLPAGSAAAAAAVKGMFSALMRAHGTRFMTVAAAVVLGMGTLGRPLLHDGFPAGHDAPAHITYTYLFDLALGQGQFPVRWTQGVTGYGQPLFSFYQPGFYYLVELVHLVVPHLSIAMKATVALMWTMGAGFMFLLCRPYGRSAATLAAFVFACSPYLLLDVYVRAAYPEVAALACVPGVLWAIRRTAAAPGAWTVATLALLIGLLLICHLPTALIVLPVCAWWAARSIAAADSRLRAAVAVAGGVVLGAGLAAFYVLPALGEIDRIRMRALTRDYFDYRRHFVEPAQWFTSRWGYGGSEEGTADGMSFQIGLAQIAVIVAALGMLAVAVVRRRWDRLDRDLVPWLVVVAFALVMMTAASAPVWAAVPGLPFLQFPWRYLMLVALACGPLAANLLHRVPGRTLRVGVLLVAFAGMLAIGREQRKPPHYLPLATMSIDRPYWRKTTQAAAVGFVEPGYYPIDARPEALQAGAPTKRWWIASGSASVTQISARDHAVELQVQAEDAVELVIGSHAFPGWTVWIDGARVDFAIDPATGAIRVPVPAGRHHVHAAFVDTPIRRAANLLSLLSAAIWVGVVARGGLSPSRRIRDFQGPPTA